MPLHACAWQPLSSAKECVPSFSWAAILHIEVFSVIMDIGAVPICCRIGALGGLVL